MPQHDALPGIERGNVQARRSDGAERRPRKTRHRLRRGRGIKGAGAALRSPRQGDEVVLVTPAASAMAEMARTNADIQLRVRLRQLGARLMTDSAIREWHGDGATVFAYGGADERIAANSLVLSCTNIADTTLAAGAGRCAACRLARRRRGGAAHRGDGDLEGRKRGMAV